MAKRAWNKMTEDDPGAIHMHTYWLALANNEDLKPFWLRVVALAYGAQEMNGHAHYGKGTLAKFFQKKSSTLCNAIATAVDYGMLDEESNSRCLVVPKLIRGGPRGITELCPEHWRTTGRNLKLD